MPLTGEQALSLGGALSALAALAHLACIALGAPAYRVMGAGERLARAAEAGRPGPARITLLIAGVLGVWAAYAWSGAGLIGPLPFTRPALLAICAVYLARALAFPWLRPVFPENSARFWWVSSITCGAIGLVHGWGLVRLWPRL